MDWKKVLAAVFEAAIAALPPPWNAIAAIIWKIIKPLIGAGEEMSSDGTVTTAEMFAQAVRAQLVALVEQIPRPLMRLLARRLIERFGDNILMAAYNRLFGTATESTVAISGEHFQDVDELTAAALEAFRAA